MAVQQSSWRIILIVILGLQSCGSNSASGDSGASTGKELFSSNCVICHGSDGKLGASGAKDLSQSTLKPDEVRSVIMNGRGAMSSYARIFESDSVALDRLVDHVLTLRK